LPAAATERLGIIPAGDGRWRSVLELAGNDSAAWPLLCDAFPWLRSVPDRTAEQLRTDARYAGYLHRQQAEARLSRREDGVDLAQIAFDEIGGLSTEIREKLNLSRPASLGAAARIQGMTPAALASIVAFVRKRTPA
jgi:tRNA uridine 5-carboxymethylaminomethyl modification enzyme